MKGTCCGCGKTDEPVNEIKDSVVDTHDYGEWSKPIEVVYLVCNECLYHRG